MNVAAEKTVRELVLEIPAASRIFEELGIDYCCGGSKTLNEACELAQVPVERVWQHLHTVEPSPAARDWQTEPLAELIAHIKNTHHRYTANEIARLGPLFERVCSVHGNNHPELAVLWSTFGEVAQELKTHMMKEEVVLFPYIARMEEAALEKAPVPPPPFGTARNPIAMMMREHDDAGAALRHMREASHRYTPPPDACLTYETLYRALVAFEADLHQHIHRELSAEVRKDGSVGIFVGWFDPEEELVPLVMLAGRGGTAARECLVEQFGV